MLPQRLPLRLEASGVLLALALPSLAGSQPLPRPAVDVRHIAQADSSVLPADFTADGRTDLIGVIRTAESAFELAVWRGNGDGTFSLPIGSGIDASPLATGRFNADTRFDAIVRDEGTGRLLFLPGRGDGRFGTPGAIEFLDGRPLFVFANDFNGDSKRDLIVVSDGTETENPRLFALAGNGDGTFAPRVELPRPTGRVFAAFAEDLNGDGRRDVAITAEQDRVTVYLNQGGLRFMASHLTIPFGVTDIAAADLNRDRRLDLIVAHANFDTGQADASGVDVLLGNGDGTFDSPVHYQSGARSPWTVVAGDFNGDGFMDIAAGNHWWIFNDEEAAASYWDSVSILSGDGSGRFTGPATFRFDTNARGGADGNSPYTNTLDDLRTADVNGDGRLDLVASPGTILLNRAATPNRAPTADAGPDVIVNTTTFTTFLSVAIVEPDFDWLNVEWRRDRDNALVGHSPSFTYTTQQSETLTVTVTDDQGGIATDSVRLIVDRPGNDPPSVAVTFPRADHDIRTDFPVTVRWDAFDDGAIREFDVLVSVNGGAFAAIPECTNLAGTVRQCEWNAPQQSARANLKVVATDSGGLRGEDDSGDFFLETDRVALPAPWVCGDVGAVAVRGECRGIHGEDYQQIEVEGSGADIWGTADEFTFARQDVEGDFSITTRVNRVENVHQWTKVGIMIRDWSGGSPGARHASLFVTPSTVKGTAFQRRPTQGGASVSTAGPAVTAPVWLRLVRSGDVISAFVRRFTTFEENPSHGWTLIGRQQFSGLPPRLSAMLVSSSHVDGTLATGNFESTRVDATEIMQSTDIGTTTAGRTGSDGTTVTLEGDGADIWGTADAFRFHYTRWSGDGEIIARVRTLENAHAWAKAGVMIRESLTASSKHAMAIVSSSKGIAMQYRGVTGGSSLEAARTLGAAPKWLRIERRGNAINTYISDGEVSPDGHFLVWEPLGGITLAMPTEIYLGLAVTSHSTGTLATAVFDDVIVQR